MKKTLLFVLALAMIVNLAYAGDARPMNKAGNKALLFDLGGLANLSAGNYRGGVGVKYFFQDNFAFRLGLGMSSTSSTTKNTANPLPANQAGESKLTEFNIALAPGIQYNMVTSNSVVAYAGAQVAFSLPNSRERTGSTNLGAVGFDLKERIKETGTTIGVGVFFGVEWFAWENISFAAEYQLGFTTSSGTVDQTDAAGTSVSTDKPSATSIGLGSMNAANLTLAVYF